MIKVESLTKRYAGLTAVDDVSFTAAPGRVTGFLGPNGAGKSTTMRVLVGLTPATSGVAEVCGRRFCDLPNPGLVGGSCWTLRHSMPAGRVARSWSSASG